MSLDHLSPETLGALVDGELSSLDQARAQAHLGVCHDCAKAVIGLQQLRSATRRVAFCNLPSPEVLTRLRAGARQADDRHVKPIRLRDAALTAAAALILVVATLGAWRWIRQSDALIADLLDQHLSTLSQASAPQVVSSDRHTVKPWFEGKLPFSFNLPESNALPADTVLIGADLVYVHGKPTALLLFTIHKHRTSVFVGQADSFAGIVNRQTRAGFEFIEAKAAGLEFLGVGDVNPVELNALLQSLKAAQ